MSDKRVFSSLAVVAIAMLGVAATRTAMAETFPARPIQLISPFQPGSTDTMLRPFAEKMQEFLGQPVVLNFKPGAGGAVGAGFVAASKPDGYTLVGSSIGSLVLLPMASKEARYTLESFTPVAALAEGNLLLVVPANSQFQSLKGLVEHAKKNPGQVTYTSSGTMGITHVMTEMFGKEAGVKLHHIPFQGSGPGISAVLGGHVNMAATAGGPAQAHVKAGTLRPLAVFGETRMKLFPEVPTFKELGYNVASPVVYGILAPKGTPKEVVDTLYAAVKKTVEKYGDPIGANLAVAGAEIRLLDPNAYSAYLKTQNQVFSRAVKELELDTK